VETVRELLKTRIDIDHVNNLGWTALLEAVILGDGGPAHTEIVGLLVAAGANVKIADRQGVTPLETRAAAQLPGDRRDPGAAVRVARISQYKVRCDSMG
jgi:ankyrin repeat protein